jgi:stage II sporulation protein D
LRVLSILLSIILIVFLPAPTQAQDYFIFKGKGYGHGIGMCQWGTYGRALRGQTYKQILTHYFQGTTIKSGFGVSGNRIRVRLFGTSTLSKVFIKSANQASFKITDESWKSLVSNAQGTWSVVSNSAGKLDLISPAGKTYRSNITSPLIFSNPTGALTLYNASGKRYHAYEGALFIYASGSGRLYVVNRVVFEPTYLNGISEVPASWPYQALYAQAVASRSYAIANLKSRGTYDLYDSVLSQVYTGIDKVNSSQGGRWAKAVADTKGQVITYAGRVISAFYFSSCGGMTENIENVWPGSSPRPYLKAVSDKDSFGKPYCQQSGNKYFTWEAKVDRATLESKLGVSNIKGFKVIKTGVSPRIVRLRIIKQDGSYVEMSGYKFRSRLGGTVIKSTWLTSLGGSFADVGLDNFAFDEIEELLNRNIITGFPDGTFRPDKAVTRAEFAVMLARALGLSPSGIASFRDAQTGWATGYIKALTDRGIFKGYPNNIFRPNRYISRAEVAEVLVRAKNLSSNSLAITFRDTLGHWAKRSIAIVVSHQIMSGYPDATFRPNNYCSRAEGATVIYRILQING